MIKNINKIVSIALIFLSSIFIEARTDADRVEEKLNIISYVTSKLAEKEKMSPAQRDCITKIEDLKYAITDQILQGIYKDSSLFQNFLHKLRSNITEISKCLYEQQSEDFDRKEATLLTHFTSHLKTEIAKENSLSTVYRHKENQANIALQLLYKKYFNLTNTEEKEALKENIITAMIDKQEASAQELENNQY